MANPPIISLHYTDSVCEQHTTATTTEESVPNGATNPKATKCTTGRMMMMINGRLIEGRKGKRVCMECIGLLDWLPCHCKGGSHTHTHRPVNGSQTEMAAIIGLAIHQFVCNQV